MLPRQTDSQSQVHVTLSSGIQAVALHSSWCCSAHLCLSASLSHVRLCSCPCSSPAGGERGVQSYSRLRVDKDLCLGVQKSCVTYKQKDACTTMRFADWQLFLDSEGDELLVSTASKGVVRQSHVFAVLSFLMGAYFFQSCFWALTVRQWKHAVVTCLLINNIRFFSCGRIVADVGFLFVRLKHLCESHIIVTENSSDL